MINMGLLKFLYCCFGFVLLFCCCCFGFGFIFFNWLIGRVLVLKGQYYSSQSTPFTQDEISETGTVVSILFSASVGCLLKVRWAPKCYLLFFFFNFSGYHEIPSLPSSSLCCLLFLCCLYPLLVLLAFPNSLLAFLCSSSFICAIPWSFMLNRHELTASFQESQMKWA